MEQIQRLVPAFDGGIVGWHPERLGVQLTSGAIIRDSAQAAPPDAPQAIVEADRFGRIELRTFTDRILT